MSYKRLEEFLKENFKEKCKKMSFYDIKSHNKAGLFSLEILPFAIKLKKGESN